VRVGRSRTWLRLFSTPTTCGRRGFPTLKYKAAAPRFREPLCCSPPSPGVPCTRSRSSQPQSFAQAKSPGTTYGRPACQSRAAVPCDCRAFAAAQGQWVNSRIGQRKRRRWSSGAVTLGEIAGRMTMLEAASGAVGLDDLRVDRLIKHSGRDAKLSKTASQAYRR
jgi:hypothetical protein